MTERTDQIERFEMLCDTWAEGCANGHHEPLKRTFKKLVALRDVIGANVALPMFVAANQRAIRLAKERGMDASFVVATQARVFA